MLQSSGDGNFPQYRDIVLGGALLVDGTHLLDGIISLDASASSTGTIDWYVLFEPLTPGAQIVAL